MNDDQDDEKFRMMPMGDIGEGRIDQYVPLSLLRARHVEPSLTVIGSGPESAPLAARVRALGLDSQVRFAGVLRGMGCRVEEKGGGTLVSRQGTLRGIDTAMGSMPDAVPALVAAALFAEGESRIRGIGQLRFKESNRLEGFALELRKLGGEIAVEGDLMTVRPRPLHGAVLETHDDHRLAMSFALVGLRVAGVQIEDPECVRKSFPRFWDEFDGLIEQSAHQG